MQSVQIYGKILNEPQFKLLNIDNAKLNVLSFDVKVWDTDTSFTIFHCITFNNMALALSDKLLQNKEYLIQGIMQINRYFGYKGIKSEVFTLLIKSVTFNDNMYLSNDSISDLECIHLMNENFIYV